MSLKLYPFQKQTLALLEKGGHILCVAPTGSGKSLIFERFARQSKLKTLIITPLVALSRQHSARLKSIGLREDVEFRIISPEKIPLLNFKNWRPDWLVVDECHSIWEWGEDFRPSFRLIPSLIKKYGLSRSLWLTATLPLDARADLKRRMTSEARAQMIEVGSFALPKTLNIRAVQLPMMDRPHALLTHVPYLKKSTQGIGLIFVQTREDTHRIARLLSESRTARFCVPYHAGLSREERLNIESLLNSAQVDVLVSTSAFGMGMNLSSIEWVILWEPTPTLLSLAQSIGRVARAGESGEAYIYWDFSDFEGRPNPEREKVFTFLRSQQCRRNSIASYFGTTGSKDPCLNCDRCAQLYH